MVRADDEVSHPPVSIPPGCAWGAASPHVHENRQPPQGRATSIRHVYFLGFPRKNVLGFKTFFFLVIHARRQERVRPITTVPSPAHHPLPASAISSTRVYFTSIMRRVPPSTPFISGMKPQQIVFPEDKLIRAYYNRHPTAKFLPIDLQSTQTHFIRNFARRQLKLIRQRRIHESEALKLVEAEAREEDRLARLAWDEGRRFVRHLTPEHTIQRRHIEEIQQEEELAWAATKEEKRRELVEEMRIKLASEQGYHSHSGAGEEQKEEVDDGAGEFKDESISKGED